MPAKRTQQAYAIVGVSGTNGGPAREQKPIDIFASQRIRTNIRAVLDDKDAFLTPAYTLALQAEHLLQVIEGKRTHVLRQRRTAQKWGREKRADLLADPRSAAELGDVYGVTASAIYQQRVIARREAA